MTAVTPHPPMGDLKPEPEPEPGHWLGPVFYQNSALKCGPTTFVPDHARCEMRGASGTHTHLCERLPEPHRGHKDDMDPLPLLQQAGRHGTGHLTAGRLFHLATGGGDSWQAE